MSQNILFVGSFNTEGKRFIKKHLNNDFTAYFAETLSDVCLALNDFDFEYCLVIGYYFEVGELKANTSKVIYHLLSKGNEVRYLFLYGCDDLYYFYGVSRKEDEEVISDLGNLIASFSNFGLLGFDRSKFANYLHKLAEDELLNVELVESPQSTQVVIEKKEIEVPKRIFMTYNGRYIFCLN